MQELQKFLNDHGFFPSEILLDQTKVQRFVRDGGRGKRNAWLVGFTNFQTDTGKEYIVCVFGDWSTDEEFTYKSTHISFSPSDQQVIEKKIREKKIKAEKERILFQKEAQKEAIDYITFGKSSGESTYLKNKGFEGLGLFGAKIYEGDFDKPCLVVPMRDSSGTLWSLQKIYSDGSKFFLTGGRTAGCFHTLGGEIESGRESFLILCEGFATGISIHLATEKKVIVCFSAHNLEKVAKTLKTENPDCAFLIAGDDDHFKEKNTGREYAEKAAIRCMGQAVFPVFPWGNETGKDFNDLEQQSGREAVKKQIEAVGIVKTYVRCLGHKEGNYFYTSSSNQEISILRAHGPENLLGLMPLSYWQAMYEKKSKKEDNGQVDWLRAASELKSKCHDHGIFYIENLRGHGVWMDEKRVVVHLGNRLWVDGKEIGIHDIKTRFNYELLKSKNSIHKQPLTVEECQPIIQFIDALSLEDSQQRFLLGGWLIASMLSGLLQWRPHLFLSAEAGSGKSVLMDSFIRPLLGQNLEFVSGEKTTEAGIRQLMHSSALPLLIDEFDLYGNNAAQRNDSVLSLIRQASSSTGRIVHGSAHAKHVEYYARFCAFISAINNTSTNRQADATRFLQVEMKKSSNKTQWENARKYLPLFTENFSDRLFARVLSQVENFQKNNLCIHQYLSSKYTQRIAQLYAPTLSGWAIMVNESALTEEQVEQLCELIEIKQITETDHFACEDFLLWQKVNWYGKSPDTYSLDERIETSIQGLISNSRNDILETYGIKDIREKGVFVQLSNPQIKKFYMQSDWSNSYKNLLKRASIDPNYRARIQGVTVSGVLLTKRC